MSDRQAEETTWYLFSVNAATPPAMTIDSGEEMTLVVRGAFADVRDIRDVPTPFTPACDGHPLAPIAGPVRVRGAEPGDAVAIDLLEITPHTDGITAIVRDFGVLRKEYGDPKALACPVRDGRAWFGGRIPIPLNPNLGTVSTMPPDGYKPSYAGPYGGDFDYPPGEPASDHAGPPREAAPAGSRRLPHGVGRGASRRDRPPYIQRVPKQQRRGGAQGAPRATPWGSSHRR